NGCEAKLATDLNNCGACAKPCQGGGQNAVAACVNGVCSFACNAGFGDCDGNKGNGCEARLDSDNLNCGACGKACQGNQSCASGICTDTVLSFDFEENGGNQVVDGSPQHNNGTLAGNFTRVQGRVGNAIHFDGTSYITVPDAVSLNPTSI